jgi:hypothetical protein
MQKKKYRVQVSPAKSSTSQMVRVEDPWLKLGHFDATKSSANVFAEINDKVID